MNKATRAYNDLYHKIKPEVTLAVFERIYKFLHKRLRADDQTFAITFDTRSHPGFVHVVQIMISEDVMMDDDVVSVNLCDHKHYNALQAYVLANPR